MTQQHTPGPWSVRGNRVTDETGNAFAFLSRTPGVCDAEDWANARLIAAAPALLTALESAAEWAEQFEDVGMDEWTRQVLTAARAAIAAAREEG